MTSGITSPSPSSLLTWLSAIETSPTSILQDSAYTQASPSVRRKRQRSVGTTTPVHKKRRITRSLDGLRGLIHEEASSEGFKRGTSHTRVRREPLHDLSRPNSAINMAEILDPRVTPKTSDKSGDAFAAYATPSASSSASIPIPGLKLTTSTHNVRQTLAQHGMQIDVERLREDYKPFEHMARKILSGERGSTMKQGSAEHIIRWIRQNKTRSEETIMAQLIPMIIPASRKVQKGTAQDSTTDTDVLHMNAASRDRSQTYHVKFFSDDGALVNINRQFNRDVLPTWLKAEDQARLRKMLAKEPGMTAPKPDYTYGIRENQYPDILSQKFGTHTRALMGVAPEMVHPYFIIEGKTTKGDLADAENQAIRGGATLVRARRLLNAKAGVGDVAGPDPMSFVYSMTMDTNIARIWLNWCEILPKQKREEYVNDDGLPKDEGDLYETYHMNPLYTALLDDEEMLKELRRKLNNIIDWGCIQRMNEVNEVMNIIYRIEQAAEREASAEVETGSPRKKQKLANS
ncbi:hypothetical protein BDR22DRAFT_49414 [Usnea florida]